MNTVHPFTDEDLEMLWESHGLDESDIEDMRDGNPSRFDHPNERKTSDEIKTDG